MSLLPVSFIAARPRRSLATRVRGAAWLLCLAVLIAPAGASAALPADEINPWTVSDPVVSHGKTFASSTSGLACEVASYGKQKPQLICEVRYREAFPNLPTVVGASMSKWCRVDFSSEWGNGVALKRSGKAQPACASGVMVLAKNPKPLAVNTRWRRGKFACLSRADGLRCATKSGAHGFHVDDLTMRVW